MYELSKAYFRPLRLWLKHDVFTFFTGPVYNMIGPMSLKRKCEVRCKCYTAQRTATWNPLHRWFHTISRHEKYLGSTSNLRMQRRSRLCTNRSNYHTTNIWPFSVANHSTTIMKFTTLALSTVFATAAAFTPSAFVSKGISTNVKVPKASLQMG